MVLQGFYHDSSLFTYIATSVHAEENYDKHCVRESPRGGGTQEDGAIERRATVHRNAECRRLKVERLNVED